MTAPCQLCKTEIHTDKHPIAAFPCSHCFHLYCLLDSYTIRQIESKCPACEPSDSKHTHESLLRIFLNAKRSLNLGNSLSDLHLDIKIDLIQKIVEKRYKNQLSKVSKIKEYKHKKNRKSKRDYSEDQDFERIEPILSLIQTREDIVLLYRMNYTMTDVLQSRITIEHLITCGYGMIDWFILQAEWDELISMQLCPDLFKEHPEIMDISSIIEMYGLKFRHLFVDLCDSKLSEMAKLKLSKQNMKDIEFSDEALAKHRIRVEDFRASPLWSTLTTEDWTDVLISAEHHRKKVK
jgi:hypothetical protein